MNNATELLLLGGAALAGAATFETIIGPLIAVGVGIFIILWSKS